MNEPERSELEQVKRRFSELEQELAALARRLQQLDERVNRSATAPAQVSPARPAPEQRPPAIPPPLPPIIPKPHRPPPAPEAAKAETFLPAQCQHCGADIKFAAIHVGDSVPCPVCGKLTFLTMETRRSSAQVSDVLPSSTPTPSAPPATERSFEMRLGTYWLVRVGIVMLLTGLVFFGNYAYQNFVVQLGPVGKVCLLYLASGLLLAAGMWWQRKAVKESLRNYAQVLFAGGLAAVYFTTYAAHHIPTLKVIRDPLLDGLLLLGWTAFIAWIADRKKSEVLALFSVGLAYYTSVMTRVGHFTLYSNLLLTVAAVFFLVRNRWTALSMVSLVATYFSYAFWRFFDGSNWAWASPGEGLWHGTYFLISYWVVFTSAVFLSRHEKLSGANRAMFLTFNNVAFFAMFVLTMAQVQHGGFWKFCIYYGAVLLALAEAARLILRDGPHARNSYLTQGLLLVTIGLISKYSGLQLALLLGAESVVLFALGSARKSLIMQTSACIAGALAIGWGIDGLERDNNRTLLFEAALGMFMAFNAWWAHRDIARENQSLLRGLPAYFTILALISWFAATWFNTSSANFPLALAIEALLLTASVYILRVREFAVLGQSYLVLALFAWMIRFVPGSVPPPWWNPALLIGITLGMTHWWQRQTILPPTPKGSLVWPGVYAFAIVATLFFWLEPIVPAPAWIALTALLALVFTGYAAITRAWMLALFGQIFVFVSVIQFTMQLSGPDPVRWLFSATPIAALLLLSFATMAWFKFTVAANTPVRDTILQFTLVYRWIALALSIWWINEYVSAREIIWVTMLVCACLFAVAGFRRSREAFVASMVFAAVALAQFWFPTNGVSTIYAPNLLAIISLLALQRVAHRNPSGFQISAGVHQAMIIAGGTSIWLFLTCAIGGESGLIGWLWSGRDGAYLTASWAALALILFTAGMAVRERMYRWLGLAVLGCALGRVIIFDVWKLETLLRILSFMALGIVLLVLGFIYNKYQEKIKEWL